MNAQFDRINEMRTELIEIARMATGISEARKKLYGAYAEIAKILKAQHPESNLYHTYNLQDA